MISFRIPAAREERATVHGVILTLNNITFVIYIWTSLLVVSVCVCIHFSVHLIVLSLLRTDIHANNKMIN